MGLNSPRWTNCCTCWCDWLRIGGYIGYLTGSLLVILENNQLILGQIQLLQTIVVA